MYFPGKRLYAEFQMCFPELESEDCAMESLFLCSICNPEIIERRPKTRSDNETTTKTTSDWRSQTHMVCLFSRQTRRNGATKQRFLVIRKPHCASLIPFGRSRRVKQHYYLVASPSLSTMLIIDCRTSLNKSNLSTFRRHSTGVQRPTTTFPKSNTVFCQ